MLAFQQALTLPIDGLELDVQLSDDGVPVIMHDETVDRTTDGAGPVRSFSAAELGKLNAACLWKEQGVPACPVPALSDVLAWTSAEHPDVLINLELKVFDDHVVPLVNAVVRCVDQFPNVRDQILFSSFHHDCLSALTKVLPAARLGFLYGPPVAKPHEVFRAHAGHWVNLRHDWTDGETIAACHSAGATCCVWTVDDPDLIRKFLDLGADVIITNVPDVAHLVRDQWLAERSAGGV